MNLSVVLDQNTKHPDPSGHLGQVYCVVPEPEPNKVKQHFVTMLLHCGTNSPNTWGLLKLSVHLNLGKHCYCNIVTATLFTAAFSWIIILIPICISFNLSRLMLCLNYFKLIRFFFNPNLANFNHYGVKHKSISLLQKILLPRNITRFVLTGEHTSRPPEDQIPYFVCFFYFFLFSQVLGFTGLTWDLRSCIVYHIMWNCLFEWQ